MTIKQWTLAGLVGAAILSGCTKRPPPAPPSEPTPPKVEAPAPTPPPAPVVEAPAPVDTTALHRQHIQARIADVFKPLYFAFDQSSLDDAGKGTCEAIGQLMKDAPEITVQIAGNADERGTNEYNLALGERRAQAVQEYLTSYGIEAGRLSVISYGEEKPAVDGHDESAWSKNRRVEFSPSF